MKALAAQLALAFFITGGVAVGAGVALVPTDFAEVPMTTPTLPDAGSKPPLAQHRIDSAARSIARAAPFRVSRKPSSVRYNPSPDTAAPAAEPPAVAKPGLALAGIVWGRSPSVVLDGVPGAGRSRVMERGDTAGGLRVQRVERERVVVTGYDTTWTLDMSAP